MSNAKAKVVQLRRAAPFLLEFQSERMVDALSALNAAGFKVTHVIRTKNRLRIQDAQEQKA